LSALDSISTALDIVQCHIILQCWFSSFNNQLFKLDFDIIKYYVFDKESNIFIDHFKEILPDIIAKNADYIGISINSSNQIVAGLTLAHMLKTKQMLILILEGIILAELLNL
jgi:hypothetical protein